MGFTNWHYLQGPQDSLIQVVHGTDLEKCHCSSMLLNLYQIQLALLCPANNSKCSWLASSSISRMGIRYLYQPPNSSTHSLGNQLSLAFVTYINNFFRCASFHFPILKKIIVFFPLPSITLYLPAPPGITTLLSMSMSPFSFLLNPSTP